ncbi:MAG: hypothetical protein CM1200mP36_01120 [Gammaproteobacteria bacterium]|nr:MAG: hypothetical protein CM1200mP36_01120 [Gammaproteobacteria bacterium]
MRRYYFSWFLMLVCVSGVSHARGGSSTSIAQINSSSIFPGNRKCGRRLTVCLRGHFPARVYSVEASSGVYSVTVVDYRESERIHSERTDRTEANSSSSVWVTDVRASVAHAAQGFEGEVGKSRTMPGPISTRLKGTSSRSPTPISPVVLWQFICTTVASTFWRQGSLGIATPGLFQQSLGILDDEGRRLRYQIDAEGRKTRMQGL